MNLNASQRYSRTGHKWLFVAVPAIVIGLSIWAWFGVIRYHVLPKKFGVVVPGHIYRSGQISAPLIKKILTKHNIRVIVELSSVNPNNPEQRAEEKAAAELNIKVLRFPMSGNGTGDVNDYAGAVTAIAHAEKQNLPVLVHCAAGAYRTGGVIAIYQVLVQKIDPAFVISEMEALRLEPKGNPDLPLYLNSNMAQLAEMLKQAGVIEEIPAVIPQIPHS